MRSLSRLTSSAYRPASTRRRKRTAANKSKSAENESPVTHQFENVKLFPHSSPPIQTKLTVNEPGDKYEQEADSVADKIMDTTDSQQIQRKCSSCEDEDKKIQRKPASTDITPLIQTKGGDGAVAGPALSNKIADTQGSGSSLDNATGAFMSDRFGVDFGGVKIHADNEAAKMNRELNARAFTTGNDIYFNEGEYNPGSGKGKRLLAHELTHVVQQNSALQNGAIQRAGAGDVKLAEAKAAEAEAAEQLKKRQFFDRIRAKSPTADAKLKAEVESTFAENTDDRWLAEKIMKNGPEPLWPKDDIIERQKKAIDNKWAPEPGNIAGTLGTGAHTVQAFYFRGTTDRRALIIGGVHGSEPGGVEVVNDLLDLLRAPNAPMPFFSIIIVPELFSANVHSSRPLSERRTSGGTTKQLANGKATDVDTPDPNRQFPAVGKDAAKDSTLGCLVDSENRCIEPENIVLMDLINRFQPERVASVHGHSVPKNDAQLKKEGGPSITTDPRPGHEADDDALTLKMAKEADKLGVRVPGNFLGKKDERTRYPTGTAPKMSKGITFGQWGSHDTPTRPAMNIVLIETFGNATSASLSGAKAAARKAELMNTAQVLRDFFLAP
ncbi:eCIS core domain-containing protein [Mucilaginibacter flavidus]|uniref:eCIS core domain-containing protein n=1 Tax=Mucilaginibacter flavidus TaxID=2949309 RepID=UPI0020932F4E|nr:DUF4157 domain-containing protein [Mucilaginibacter flavidus]MCO5947151.1 DUF4157 domain-containing protein [Mucilaginibacter flavidus]